MLPDQTRAAVLDLIEAGVNDCAISRATEVPRTTVRDLRHRYQRTGRRPRPRPTCPRCWRPARQLSFSSADYSELLGLYLGDGHISEGARTARLRIALDSKYVMVIDEADALLRRVFPFNSVGRQFCHGGNLTVLWVYSSHLPCLFPQHGRGLKHLRPITLENWQIQLVEQEPWPLIRGLIRSDGCSFVNRTGPYEYLSFCFSNCSAGIVDLFLGACEAVGVLYRINFSEQRRIWHVRINRRESVALMLEHVGVKE